MSEYKLAGQPWECCTPRKPSTADELDDEPAALTGGHSTPELFSPEWTDECVEERPLRSLQRPCPHCVGRASLVYDGTYFRRWCCSRCRRHHLTCERPLERGSRRTCGAEHLVDTREELPLGCSACGGILNMDATPDRGAA